MTKLGQKEKFCNATACKNYLDLWLSTMFSVLQPKSNTPISADQVLSKAKTGCLGKQDYGWN